MRRAQFAGYGVLLFTSTLAVVALWLAHHSFQQTQKVAEASVRIADERARVEEALWVSQIAHAGAVLESGKPGASTEALQAIRQAARRRTSPELRDQAIAALSLGDIGSEETFREFLPDGSGIEQLDPTRLSVAPNLKYITRSHSDGSVQCARFDDGQIIWEFKGSGKPVTGPVVWSPDSEYVAVQHGVRLRVHHLKTGRQVFESPCNESPGMHVPTAFSPDSSNLFAWVGGAGLIVDLGSGKVISRLPKFEQLFHAAFHPKRPWVSLVTGKVIEVWDYSTSQRVVSLAPDSASSRFNHHAWRDDGLALAAAGDDSYVYVWDATTFNDDVIRWHALRGHLLPVIYVAFNHAGDTLVSSSAGRETRWWNPYAWSGESLRQLSYGYGVQFGPDDQSLAFLQPSRGVSVRPVTNHPAMQRLAGPIGYGAPLSDARFSADGRWIAAGSWDGLFIWDAASNWVVARGPAPNVRSVLFRSMGNEIITTGTGGVRRWPWNVTTNSDGQIEGHLGQPVLVPLPDGAQPIKAVLNHDETRLLVGANNECGYLFALDKNTPPVVLRGQAGLDTIAFSPDGTRIASGTWLGKSVWIWDAVTGKPLRQIPSLDADVGYTQDGQWLIISQAAGHSFWHTSSNTVLKSFPREAGEQNTGRLAFLPDGRTVAWNHAFNQAQLVDTDSLRVLANFSLPGDQKIEWLRASPDGRWLGVFAGQVYLYDLQKLHRELDALGLDWQKDNQPLAPAAPKISTAERTPRGFLANAGGGPGNLATLIPGGLLLALGLGGLTQRYHRRLLATYFELETTAARRNESLMRAQAELQHGHKMQALGNLAAGIAHDFNNLLSVISISNQLTAERTKGDADLEENHQLINQSVAHGRAVVRSLLGHSRESQDRSSFSVNQAVRDTALLLRQQFLQGIHLHLDLDTPTPAVTGVRTRLDQILLNLIVNAAEALENKGELRLGVSVVSTLPEQILLRPHQAAEWIEVTVADNGPGMTAEIKAQVFEPFFSTKQTSTRPGTGLGLSMVHAISESAGFGLGLESESGHGATFRIYIPVVV